MAEASILPANVLLSKRVQERVLNGEEPQPPYVCRDDSTDENVPVSQSSSIPFIDLSLLSSLEPSTAEQELQKLRSALSSWGCFQAIGHGIPKSFLDQVRQVAREFFEQPMEEKGKCAKGVEEMEGYGADPVPAEGQSLDWSDRIFLEVYPEDKRNPIFWPQNPKSFSGVVEDYTTKVQKLTETISKSMAKSLDVQETCFLDQFGERAALQARLNYYSPCPRPDLVLGLKPHADGSGYTIVLQDDVGLQIQKDGQWFTLPIVPESLLVLMGDQMEIMSNGMFRSPVHRVLTNSERARVSVAIFYAPDPEKEIGPEEGLINEERPRIFKKVKDYANIHWGYYQQGQRALHVAKA
ncbi:hypothetical protein Tsubulata_014487 [Turnera subulata]|uniref:Fe2OG dioxygenase domain-containing protein n=1 Tax=Turnera subulata TaxID=218843 RepID=A0A9Q0GLK4_9ROSI|nr:hypothetical protein Tsubulata_014487 [Turnera subulata]